MPPVKRPSRIRRRTYFKEWREFSTDMSQNEVAKLIERDSSSLHRLEAGLIPYNQDWLEILAEVYRCEPYDLISRDPNGVRAIPSDVFREFQAAPAHVQRQILATTRALLRPNSHPK
jgi:hypothetical protein